MSGEFVTFQQDGGQARKACETFHLLACNCAKCSQILNILPANSRCDCDRRKSHHTANFSLHHLEVYSFITTSVWDNHFFLNNISRGSVATPIRWIGVGVSVRLPISLQRCRCDANGDCCWLAVTDQVMRRWSADCKSVTRLCRWTAKTSRRCRTTRRGTAWKRCRQGRCASPSTDDEHPPPARHRRHACIQQPTSDARHRLGDTWRRDEFGTNRQYRGRMIDCYYVINDVIVRRRSFCLHNTIGIICEHGMRAFLNFSILGSGLYPLARRHPHHFFRN